MQNMFSIIFGFHIYVDCWFLHEAPVEIIMHFFTFHDQQPIKQYIGRYQMFKTFATWNIPLFLVIFSLLITFALN